MARGSKASYTDKQIRQAHHIEKAYEHKGLSHHDAQERGWRTVNKHSGGRKR